MLAAMRRIGFIGAALLSGIQILKAKIENRRARLNAGENSTEGAKQIPLLAQTAPTTKIQSRTYVPSCPNRVDFGQALPIGGAVPRPKYARLPLIRLACDEVASNLQTNYGIAGVARHL